MSAWLLLLQRGGRNLGDHLFVPVAYHCTQAIMLAATQGEEQEQAYQRDRQGLLTSNVGEAGGVDWGRGSDGQIGWVRAAKTCPPVVSLPAPNRAFRATENPGVDGIASFLRRDPRTVGRHLGWKWADHRTFGYRVIPGGVGDAQRPPDSVLLHDSLRQSTRHLRPLRTHSATDRPRV
jgi:hypothetical protein